MKIKKKLKKLDKAWEDFVKEVSDILDDDTEGEISFVPFNQDFWLDPALIKIKQIQEQVEKGDKKVIEVFNLSHKGNKHKIESGREVVINKDGEIEKEEEIK